MDKKYTLLQSQYVKSVDGKSKFAATIVVHKDAALPEPESEWTDGSIAFVPDASEVYMLNSEGEWKKWQ